MPSVFIRRPQLPGIKGKLQNRLRIQKRLTAIAVPAVPQVQKTPPSPVEAGSSAKEKKKLLKAQLKAQKKAAKAANKESS